MLTCSNPTQTHTNVNDEASQLDTGAKRREVTESDKEKKKSKLAAHPPTQLQHTRVQAQRSYFKSARVVASQKSSAKVGIFSKRKARATFNCSLPSLPSTGVCASLSASSTLALFAS